MADVKGLHGFNKTDGTDRLLAVYGRDIVNVENGVGYGQNILSNNKAEFETFLDRAWFINGQSKNRYFDGSTWTTTGAATRFPLARYIQLFKTRLYVAYINILSTDYPSRVWYSDLPEDNDITWGYETQTNLQQGAGGATVVSPGAQFETLNIKVGDPIFITTGPNIGEYKVSSVDSETQLTLTETLPISFPASTYWAGGNWLDVSTDDNDVITGLGTNSNHLLIFKRDSLHRYDGTSLKQVKGVPGTTSGRSVVNIKEFTFYFHRTGVYLYDGVNSSLVSRKVQDYIDAMSSSNYDSVVAWVVNDETYRVFIGDLSDTNKDIDITNAYLDYDIATQTWSVGRYPESITVATKFIEDQIKNVYFGTTTDSVHRDNTSNSDDATAIEMQAETTWHFPFGTEVESQFARVRVYAREGRGAKVSYKLYGIGTSNLNSQTVSKDWLPLGDIDDYITEFDIPINNENKARGIKFLVSEIGTRRPPIIERIDVFARPLTGRLKE